jgi:L-iditol 2-dehydrogenase
MKALIKTKKGPGNVELIEIPEPACKADEIKIRVKAVGICGTDLHILEDSFPYYNPPVILGHEFSGEVAALGKGVKNYRKLKPGDRVGVLPSAAIICGKCEYCRSGNFIFCPSRKGMGHGTDGAMTEYVCISEDLVYRLPDNISFETATLLEPLACCVQAVDDFIKILPEHYCMVSGPGTIGLLVLTLLKLKKCRTLLAGISKDKERLDMGKRIGADLVVDTGNEDAGKVLEERYGKDVFDICFECSGASGSFKNCIDKLKKMGTLIQMGIFHKDFNFDFNNVIFKQLAVYGSLGFTWKVWERSLELMKENKLGLDLFITDSYRLAEWEKAFNKAAESGSLKVIIQPDLDGLSSKK